MSTAKIDTVQYANDFKKAHHRYEVYAYNQFKPALDKQVSAVVSHVRAYGNVSDSSVDLLVSKKPLESTYQSVYVNIGSLHAQWTLTRINKFGKKSFFSEAWRKLMNSFYENNAADRVSDVTDTTRDRIKGVLKDSQDLPTSQRADYIVKTLDDPEFNRNRALMIARTESTAAANKGASLGNEDADYETVKQWIAIEDANTRPTHSDADGEIVGNNELFTVGSSQCQYPGDLSLPPAECINCRCTVAYVAQLDDMGLPILK